MKLVRIACLCAAFLAAGCASTSVNFRNAEIADAPWPQRTITALLAKPEGEGPFPAVVLLHSCGGVQPHVSQDWPEWFVKNGYVALTVDSFGSRGLPPCPNPLHPADRTPKTDAYREITRDAFGALDYLHMLPFVKRGRVAVIGFSLGANTINSFLLHQPPRPQGGFAAAVGVYGRCHDMARYPKPAIPVLQIGGELDPAHADSCRAVASMVDVHVLPGAHHAWDSAGSSRSGTYGETIQYSPAATARSRELVRAFLQRHLAQR